MAPELHLGRPADARSDQYSFCVALFEALHGRRPFPGRTWQTLSPQVLRAARELPAARAVPPHLRRAVDRGLAAAPERRFPDMDAMLRELVRDPVPRGARHYLALGTGLSALASLLALSVWLARPSSDAAPAPSSPSTTPAHACAQGSAGCAQPAADARVEALSSQLELARALRRDRRPTQALELLSALADAARDALGAGHELHRVIERERDALTHELQPPPATPR
ncbi:protein kinase [Nannocystis sp.]|uniref:protein kinase n=1 Tax=Nannocystis sp. TaxID=1962667 RepID=UPI0025E6DC98|nr:protein kinase [Nannocystis sp.]MBK7830107.1 protein kinase [Nannocystis sp.]